MLAQLLSSKPKTKLINLFLAHPGRSFSFTELRLSSGCSKDLLKKTLNELKKMDFLIVHEKGSKFYQVNKHFPLYPELVNLLRKAKKIPEDILQKNVLKVGNCRFIALTGVFVGKPRIETDILFVGRVNGKKLKTFLKLAEKLAEQEVSYTVLTPSEFEYRKIMNDRFVKNILDNSPVAAVDHTKTRAKILHRF